MISILSFANTNRQPITWEAFPSPHRTSRFLLFFIVLASAVLSAQAHAESTADHSKFEELKGPFDSGPAVTRACLGCHTEAAKQLHKTTHWTWAFDNPVTGQQLGKKNIVNNFCVATASNWPRCTSCHIGYGWKDANFDLTAEENVDCLVCHDTTGKYKKFPTDAGHPNYVPKQWPPKTGKLRQPPDLVQIAQHVGKPSRDNCGTCHFYGGGGDGVKHGHLDSSMHKPTHAVDVHMDVDGLNFSCQTCHTAGGHEIAGSRYTTKASDDKGIDIPGRGDGSRATCASCHGNRPHGDGANAKLDQHTDKVACVTCHVPTFARGGRKTKMWWDWSTAGRKDQHGKPIVIKDADGYPTYDFKKGDFRWEANVVPEYRWFNGRIDYRTLGATIDDTGEVEINLIGGEYGDPDARIWPFKVMRGRQPYDRENKILAVPHLFGKDDDAYWKSFDWPRAIKAGLEASGQRFSGDYGFVQTAYSWPVTHMVAPKQDALACDACHSRDGRLANLEGFYMPGRDRFAWLDLLGGLIVLGTIGGIAIHGAARLIARSGRRKS
ncbi:MAG: tetrathionate reductase family octaheme c-type cytochrome [Gammaproteobacteria bacterium]|nr:tetrathionate reductase family octaheme c-type cytochrome [Gammaproteobacteria bacterium]